jgi:hypothetical protein
MMARFKALRIVGELNLEDAIISFEESSMMSMMAISAPPTPRPKAVVMVIALDAAALDVADVVAVRIRLIKLPKE